VTARCTPEGKDVAEALAFKTFLKLMATCWRGGTGNGLANISSTRSEKKTANPNPVKPGGVHRARSIAVARPFACFSSTPCSPARHPGQEDSELAASTSPRHQALDKRVLGLRITVGCVLRRWMSPSVIPVARGSFLCALLLVLALAQVAVTQVREALSPCCSVIVVTMPYRPVQPTSTPTASNTSSPSQTATPAVSPSASPVGSSTASPLPGPPTSFSPGLPTSLSPGQTTQAPASSTAAPTASLVASTTPFQSTSSPQPTTQDPDASNGGSTLGILGATISMHRSRWFGLVVAYHGMQLLWLSCFSRWAQL
jgi:hypothetical protein